MPTTLLLAPPDYQTFLWPWFETSTFFISRHPLDPSFIYSWSISLSIRSHCRTIVQSLASRNFNDPSLNFLYQNRQPGTAKNMQGYRDLFLAPILSCVRSPCSN